MSLDFFRSVFFFIFWQSKVPRAGTKDVDFFSFSELVNWHGHRLKAYSIWHSYWSRSYLWDGSVNWVLFAVAVNVNPLAQYKNRRNPNYSQIVCLSFSLCVLCDLIKVRNSGVTHESLVFNVRKEAEKRGHKCSSFLLSVHSIFDANVTENLLSTHANLKNKKKLTQLIWQNEKKKTYRKFSLKNDGKENIVWDQMKSTSDEEKTNNSTGISAHEL